ncbi:MAG: phosphotransferase [Candidatus Dormibacteraceae bacterium]
MSQNRQKFEGGLLYEISQHAAEIFKFQFPANVLPKTEYGYEDLNSLLTVGNDCYFLKVFAKRSINSAKVYVNNHLSLLQSIANLPILFSPPESSEHLFVTQTSQGPVSWCLMEYIEGALMAEMTITLTDRARIIEQMALIHSLQASITLQEDSWSPFSLNIALPARAQLLQDNERELALSITRKMEELAKAPLTIAPIHASLEPTNLIRREDGSIVLVDFGTVTRGPVVGDLSIFLASCCLDDVSTATEFADCYQDSLVTYLKHRPLQQVDLDALLAVLEATYWSYLLAAREAWFQGDRRYQTGWWLRLAARGIEQMTRYTR